MQRKNRIMSKFEYTEKMQDEMKVKFMKEYTKKQLAEMFVNAIVDAERVRRERIELYNMQ